MTIRGGNFDITYNLILKNFLLIFKDFLTKETELLSNNYRSLKNAVCIELLGYQVRTWNIVWSYSTVGAIIEPPKFFVFERSVKPLLQDIERSSFLFIWKIFPACNWRMRLILWCTTNIFLSFWKFLRRYHYVRKSHTKNLTLLS